MSLEIILDIPNHVSGFLAPGYERHGYNPEVWNVFRPVLIARAQKLLGGLNALAL